MISSIVFSKRPNSRFLAFSKLRPMVEHRTPPTHLGPILAWQEREQVLPLITNPKTNVVLLGQSLRSTNSELSIQEQLGDEKNQVNVFAVDVDPVLGEDEKELQRYTKAHQTLFEVRSSFFGIQAQVCSLIDIRSEQALRSRAP